MIHNFKGSLGKTGNVTLGCLNGHYTILHLQREAGNSIKYFHIIAVCPIIEYQLPDKRCFASHVPHPRRAQTFAC
jgi:hypothetical protein